MNYSQEVIEKYVFRIPGNMLKGTTENMYKVILEHLVISDSKEAIEGYLALCQKDHIEDGPICQR